MLFLIVFIVVATSVWVLIDAKSIGKKGRDAGDEDPPGAGGWFIVCLLFWLIAFPWYLFWRARYKRRKGEDTFRWMTVAGALIVAATIVIAILAFSGDTKTSTSHLSTQVEQSIRDSFSKNPLYHDVGIQSFQLIHKSGNEYEGRLYVCIGGVIGTEPVEVLYDGKRFTWRLK